MSLGGNPGFNPSNPLGQISSSSLVPPSSPSRMFPGSGLDSGGTSSPFNPVLAAPSPSTVSQPSSSASMANIEQIRQVRVRIPAKSAVLLSRTFIKVYYLLLVAYLNI